MAPALSICVPSRNRQQTFAQTVRDLTANPREDIEFVFADNSDDPGIADGHMAAIRDPRVRYLPSAEQALPMQDNWERVMQAATGDWIIFVGDDDYVDPDVIDTIAEIARRRPQVDAVGWARMSFKWPEYRPFSGNASVALGNGVHLADRQDQLRALFTWKGASPVPKTAFSVYHGAVRRTAMERIRDHFSGRYFEHPTVDFDCSAKLLLTARELVYIDRSFSVAGSTASSNSSAVGRFARVREINAGLSRDDGPRFEVPGFPFTSRMGVAGSILATLHWFTQRYGLPMEGWEDNFLRALEIDCGKAEDRISFDLHVATCRDALARWRDGALLDAFKPRFVPRGRSAPYTGLIGTNLFVDETIGGCRTPAEFYGFVSGILPPADALRYMFDAVPAPDAATVAA
jgi:glycosyltransferase involved in cell wall biosynthesis